MRRGALLGGVFLAAGILIALPARAQGGPATVTVNSRVVSVAIEQGTDAAAAAAPVSVAIATFADRASASPSVSVAVESVSNRLFGAAPVSVAVTRPLPGDLNLDGHVDGTDLMLLLKIYLGKVVPTAQQLLAGDTRPAGIGGHPYGDGKIRADDLNWLFRRFLGLEQAP